MTTLTCEKFNFSSQSYMEWLLHFVDEGVIDTEGHEFKSRKDWLDWQDPEISRSVVVFGLAGIRRDLVIRHFGANALVSDFVFWPDRKDFCIVQFLSADFVDVVLEKEHWLLNTRLVVKPHWDITDEVWNSICPQQIGWTLGSTSERIKLEADMYGYTPSHVSSPHGSFEDVSGIEGVAPDLFDGNYKMDTSPDDVNNAESGNDDTRANDENNEGVPGAEANTGAEDSMPNSTPLPIGNGRFVTTMKIQTNNKSSYPIPRERSFKSASIKFTGTENDPRWVEIFHEFILWVWPSCFGVQLVARKKRIPTKMFKHMEVVGQPLRGIQVDSDKLSWLSGNICTDRSPRGRVKFRRQKLIYFEKIRCEPLVPKKLKKKSLSGKQEGLQFHLDLLIPKISTHQNAEAVTMYFRTNINHNDTVSEKKWKGLLKLLKCLWLNYFAIRVNNILREG